MTLILVIVAGVLLLYVLALGLLWWAGRSYGIDIGPAAAARLLPDVLRLLRRLASDVDLGRGVRLRLWLVLAYLASPIDLIPDFIPILGYADDLLIVVLAVRSVVRRCGPAVVARRWPGSVEGLALLNRLCRLA